MTLDIHVQQTKLLLGSWTAYVCGVLGYNCLVFCLHGGIQTCIFSKSELLPLADAASCSMGTLSSTCQNRWKGNDQEWHSVLSEYSNNTQHNWMFVEMLPWGIQSQSLILLFSDFTCWEAGEYHGTGRRCKCRLTYFAQLERKQAPLLLTTKMNLLQLNHGLHGLVLPKCPWMYW